MADHRSRAIRGRNRSVSVHYSGDTGITLRMGITTNGTLLTVANCEMLQRNGIGVQLSLDGSKQGNDIHRQLMGGTQCGLAKAGAFELVQIGNYMRYFGDTTPNCRMTLTVHNLPYLSNSIRELHAQGFKSFSVIPDADCGVSRPRYLWRRMRCRWIAFCRIGHNTAILLSIPLHTLFRSSYARRSLEICVLLE